MQLKQPWGPRGVSAMKCENCFQRGMAKAHHPFSACFGWMGPNCRPDQNQSSQLNAWQQLTNFDCQHSHSPWVYRIVGIYVPDLLPITYKCIQLQLQLPCNFMITDYNYNYIFPECNQLQLQLHCNVIDYNYNYFLLVLCLKNSSLN